MDEAKTFCDASEECTYLYSFDAEYYDGTEYLNFNYGTDAVTEEWFTVDGYYNILLYPRMERYIYKNLNSASAMAAGAVSMIAGLAAAY